MISFKSKQYPTSRRGFVILQEYAMQAYGVLMMFVILAVMVRVAVGKPVLWMAIIGVAFALLIGNLYAYVQLRKTTAEIFFVNDHFSIISVYEILFEEGQRTAFPLPYASPKRYPDKITLHYHDQIMSLNKDDWDEFDLIWNWLTEGRQVVGGSG